MLYEQKSSTIIIGIFIVISAILVVWLIPFNLNEHLARLAENSNSNIPENAGEMIIIYNGVAAIGGLAILIAAYVPAFIILINSFISLIFSIKNRKSISKTIRIVNYAYDAILVVFIVFSIIKLILFRTGIA